MSTLDLVQNRKSINYRVPLNLEAENPEEWQKSEQEKIDSSEPLTEEQTTEKEDLLQSGFSIWSRRDFNQFVRAVGEYGRDNMDKICQEVEGKEPKEVSKRLSLISSHLVEFITVGFFL